MELGRDGVRRERDGRERIELGKGWSRREGERWG